MRTMFQKTYDMKVLKVLKRACQENLDWMTQPPIFRCLSNKKDSNFLPLSQLQQTIFPMASKTYPFNLQTCARANILGLEPYRCARE